MYLGGLYTQMGKTEKAMPLLQNVLQIEPNNVNANSNLGVVFTKLIEYSASHLTFKQTIKREKELIVFSEIQLVTVNKKGKLVKIPYILIKKLESII